MAPRLLASARTLQEPQRRRRLAMPRCPRAPRAPRLLVPAKCWAPRPCRDGGTDLHSGHECSCSARAEKKCLSCQSTACRLRCKNPAPVATPCLCHHDHGERALTFKKDVRADVGPRTSFTRPSSAMSTFFRLARRARLLCERRACPRRVLVVATSVALGRPRGTATSLAQHTNLFRTLTTPHHLPPCPTRRRLVVPRLASTSLPGSSSASLRLFSFLIKVVCTVITACACRHR